MVTLQCCQVLVLPRTRAIHCPIITTPHAPEGAAGIIRAGLWSSLLRHPILPAPLCPTQSPLPHLSVCSQPPLLSAMVAACFEATGSVDLLRRALPRLIRTWGYWISPDDGSGSGSGCVRGKNDSDGKSVLLSSGQGEVHRLSRYKADWDQPRPESYR